MAGKIDHKIPEFLISPRYRIYRHILLQLFILLISINVFWDNPDEILPERFTAWILYFLLLNAVVYVNMYLLTPRFLLKDKILAYILSIIGLGLFIFLFIGLLQSISSPDARTPEEQSVPEALMGIASSFLSLGLFIAGTSVLLLLKHRMEQNMRIGELESATLQSELAYLKSQINPHFLFNMLNNANIMVNEDADIASKILVKLNDLLHYQINDSTKDQVYLSADIAFLRDFLELEKTRRDHFEYTLSEEGNMNDVQLPPLLFIPFVENAVKHSSSETASYIHIHFSIQNNVLLFHCRNSKPANPVRQESGGLGLVNIKRRLDLLFGKSYSLELVDEETSYTVKLQLNL